MEKKIGDQCPTCGRVSEDWAARNIEKNYKGKQRKDSEDRICDYRSWRHTFGNGMYVNDIDQLEWRIIDGKHTPVALIELSRIDGNMKIPQKYLEAVLNRFKKRDAQGSIFVLLAKLLKIDIWIVLFRWDLSEFYLYNLVNGEKWVHLSKDEYKKWISELEVSLVG